MGKPNDKVYEIDIEEKSHASITNKAKISRSSYKEETSEGTIQVGESRELVAASTFFSGDLEELEELEQIAIERSASKS